MQLVSLLSIPCGEFLNNLPPDKVGAVDGEHQLLNHLVNIVVRSRQARQRPGEISHLGVEEPEKFVGYVGLIGRVAAGRAWAWAFGVPTYMCMGDRFNQ
jgi:hypothetical protein